MNKRKKSKSLQTFYMPMLIGMLSGGNIGAAIALEINMPGFSHLGEVTVNGINYSNVNGYASPGEGTNVYVGHSNNNSASCNTALENILTPDGKYYGWELAPNSGVYGIIYDSNVTGWITLKENNSRFELTANWASNGRVSSDKMNYNNRENCYKAVSGYKQINIPGGERSLSGQVKYGVYVDPITGKSGSYNLKFYVGKFQTNFTEASQTVDVKLTACSVLIQSHISFGDVNAGSVAPVISSEGGLDIACHGKPPTVSLSYTAHAVSATRSSTELLMSNVQNQSLGTVRGFVGNTADSDAGCNDASSSIHFGAPAKNLLTHVGSNQSYSIPLKWVLCPDQQAVPGTGTANAILNLNWR
ncbi:TPA: hypothetical protein O8L60_004619 [Enterobacter cloacae]|nr:hypothetical protein [Enterobacter cloacae]